MVLPPAAAFPTQRLAFLVLSEWEGSISSVSDSEIAATLVLVRGETEDDERELDARIPIEEVAVADRDLLRVGALFRLSVGYAITNGTRTRFSRIVVRRLPAWSRRDLQEADEIAQRRYDAISVE